MKRTPINSAIRQQVLDYWQLTKPGVTFMVIISTVGGFYLGLDGEFRLALLCHALLGSWLVAGGTNALNQLVERDIDAKMKRTLKRPLPDGRLSPNDVRIFAITISILGMAYLAFFVNILTATLALTTLLTYVCIYTPSKRKTSLSTVIGAVPGALPAMGGWAAITGEVTVEAWILFAIIFFWQLPHFMAIAWLYREDYARGGFPVLPVVDPDGIHTGFNIVANTLALLTVSLLPTIIGLTGTVYFTGAFVLGALFLFSGLRVAVWKTNQYARQLLFASIIYLPALFALMVVDKT